MSWAASTTAATPLPVFACPSGSGVRRVASRSSWTSPAWTKTQTGERVVDGPGAYFGYLVIDEASAGGRGPLGHFRRDSDLQGGALREVFPRTMSKSPN